MDLKSRKVCSLILFAVFTLSIIFSLPFLNYSIKSVYADSTNSGINFFTNMIDVSDNTVGSWTDIDVSAHVPAGTTGVILRVDTDIAGRIGDWRENGSSDDDYGNFNVYQDNQKVVYVGLDENYIFEQKINDNDLDTYLMAYTDSAVTFFADGIDYSIVPTASWETVDLSSDIPADATGAIFKIKSPGTVYEGGVRHPVSIDNHHDDICEFTWVICGINTDREIELYIENINVDHFLVGYTMPPVYFNANWNDVSLGATHSWIDIDVTAVTSADANGVIIYMKADPSWKDICIRENGSTDNPITSWMFIESFEFGACGLDGDNIFEGYISDLDCDFFVVGYTEEGDIPPADPQNEDVESTIAFNFNETIGWINVSVSHLGGYENISTVMIQVSTNGDTETANLTWTASTDTFTETQDIDDILHLYTATSESVTSGANQYNVSFSVYFKRGEPGEADVIVLSTDIESRTDYDVFTDETFLSEFTRASGFTWDYYIGDVAGGAWGRIAMDDSGNVTALSVYTMNTVHIFNSTGSIVRTLQTDPANFSASTVNVALSGDGNYLVTSCRPKISPLDMNITLWDLSDGSIVWSYYDAGVVDLHQIDINRDGSYIVSNYQSGGSYGVVFYNQDGRQWTSTTMRGVQLPQITSVSIGRDSNVIACGFADDGINWMRDGVILLSTFSAEPIWSWNMTQTSTDKMGGVEVSDNGYYIASGDGYTGYATQVNIWYYASSTPIFSENISYCKMTWNDAFDFVAEEDETDVFYITISGSRTASTGQVSVVAYNVTADTYTIWNYTDDDSFRASTMSSEMKNNRYYLAVCGDDGVFYFDTLSNTSMWIYENSTHYIGYNIDMSAEGGALASSHFNNVGGLEDPWIAYFGYVEGEAFELENFNVTNMEGCGNWVFSDERFYNFQANFTHLIDIDIIDTVGIRFSDGVNTISLYYNNTNTERISDGFSIEMDIAFDVDREPLRLNRDTSTVTEDGLTLMVVWDVWFSQHVFDELNVNVYYYMNDTSGAELDWLIADLDSFHIYNQGGLVETETDNDAGRLLGGDSLELYAYEESYVQANVTYRKLQHVHFYVRVEGNKVQWDEYESDDWNFTFGMYVCPHDEEWIEAWRLVVELDSVVGSWIESAVVGDRAFYLTWNASWWYRNSTTETWGMVLNETFSSFPVWNNTDLCYTAFWVDFWFNTANHSSVVGGRVNAEYYGIADYSDLTFFGWGSEWGAYLGNVTQSMFFHNLENTAGDVITARQIKMMKFFARVEQGDNPSRNNTIVLRDYDILDFRTTQGQMDGIATPIFVSTKMPSVPSTGFLAGLVSALSSIFSFLVTGALQVWQVFVSFLDTLFTYLGWENGFSTIMFWITTFLNYLIQGITYLVDMIISMFSLMAVWLVLGIQRFTELGTGLVVIYNNLVWIYAEASAGWVDVADIINPLLPLLPLAFFIWLLNSDDVEHVFGKLTMLWGFVRTIAGFFMQIGQYVIQLISSLIESIQW